MRGKIIAYTILIFLTVLIQSTLGSSMSVYGVKPNIILVVIVIVGLLRNNIEGAIVGFFCGLLQDSVSGMVIGFYTLLGLYLGLVIGSINKKLYRENILIAVFFTFLSTIVYEYLVYFLNTFLRRPLGFIYPMQNVILPEAIYNSVISIFVFIIVVKLHRRFEEFDKSSRRY
ncbi:rod shape-determining protein MreD [Acetivibrio cellulolyticus]|uniref:rod shape-determining protein MreD n=1 Tax=Acetivibrio cellulolyticus TaxID=35830 RepID=UPI0001E2E31F|nr:rod shape-determining protein MreD [Acetivibrio cellulolyticus]